MSAPTPFAARLVAERESAGLTQAELARRVGLTRQMLSLLEKGDREPSWPTVVALSDALGVSCDEFRGPPPATGGPARGRGRPPRQAGPGPPKRRGTKR
jgi:putative transcriptional regulator